MERKILLLLFRSTYCTYGRENKARPRGELIVFVFEKLFFWGGGIPFKRGDITGIGDNGDSMLFDHTCRTRYVRPFSWHPFNGPGAYCCRKHSTTKREAP